MNDASEPTPEGRELTVFDQAKLAAEARTVSRGFWGKLRRALAFLPFAEDLVAARYCAFDPATPAYVKAVLMAALAYFILPADVIPDFVAGFGFTDDAAVLLAALKAVNDHLRPEHRAKAKTWLEREGDAGYDP
jgi:uncharacterized membrane protein YkvA (DUF1232 family)